ncbi:hypothetical protein ABZY81_39240 [Streptomyces sp. NPDC006514]
MPSASGGTRAGLGRAHRELAVAVLHDELGLPAGRGDGLVV